MGTWGYKILEDDFALDVHEEFMGLLFDGLEADDATNEMAERYGNLDVDEHTVFWLSLAQTQLDVGRLCENVKTEAIRIIKSGEDLARYDNDPKRKRVLTSLKKKLDGPQKPPKQLKRMRIKLSPGDVFRLPRINGVYWFGRVLTSTERAFYTYSSKNKRPSLDDIVSSDILFIVGSSDDGFNSRKWHLIGNESIEKELRDTPILFCHQAVGDSYCTVFNIWEGSQFGKKASVEECEGMEIWGAWSAVHIVDRIKAHLSGEECKFVTLVNGRR